MKNLNMPSLINQVEKEEARLLYVAMTRAKKSISIILPEEIKEEHREISVDSWIEDDDSLRIMKDAGY